MTPRRPRSRTVALVAVVGVGVLASCSSDDATTEAGTSSTATVEPERTTTTTAAETAETTTETSAADAEPVATTEVLIEDYAFDPPAIEVSVGDTVTWTNRDDFKHTTTSEDGPWDSGPLDPGATFSQTFDAAGTFTYFCNIHNYMEGEVVVK